MFATDDKGWDEFVMVGILSNLSDKSKQIFTEIINSAMTGKQLSQRTKEILCYACYHSTLPISDEEVLKWRDESKWNTRLNLKSKII